jgi:hypothetical protein
MEKSMRELTSLELQAVSGGAVRPVEPHPILVAILENIVKRIEAIIIRLGGGPQKLEAA